MKVCRICGGRMRRAKCKCGFKVKHVGGFNLWTKTFLILFFFISLIIFLPFVKPIVVSANAQNNTLLEFSASTSSKSHSLSLINVSSLITASIGINYNNFNQGNIGVYLNGNLIGNITTNDGGTILFFSGVLGNLTTNNNVTFRPNGATTINITLTDIAYDYDDLNYPLIIYDFNNNVTTSNLSQILSYNISTGNQGLSSAKLSWDNVNYSFYDPSLVLFMNFDNRSALGENDTFVADLSQYSNNGTVVGYPNVTWTPNGKYGGAFNFSGLLGYIQITNTASLQTNANFSISFWMNVPNQNMDFVHKWGGGLLRAWDIYSLSSTKIQFKVANGTSSGTLLTSNAVVKDNTWHYVTFTSNDTSVAVYSDGAFDKSTTHGLTGNIVGIGNSTANIIFGQALDSTNLNGSIDNFVIYNRTLSTSEIAELYKISNTKYNSQNWSFQTTQTLNATLNSTIPTYNYNYYFCASNSSGSENCSTQKTIIQTIPTSTITANFTILVGNVRSDFYGVQATNWFGSSRLVDANGDGIAEVPSNLSWHQTTFLNSKMQNIFIGASIDTLYSNQTVRTNGVNFTGNMTEAINTVQFAAQNGKTVMVLIGYMPSWLADNSTGLCSNYIYCIPANYTIWQNIVADYLNRLTQNGLYNYTVSTVIWNEPSSSFFLGKAASDSVRSGYYNTLWNSSYQKINSVYPNMTIGGGATDETMSLILNQWILNFSYLPNITPVFHRYKKTADGNTDYGTLLNTNVNYILANCTSVSANCNHIVLAEWNTFNSSIQNDTNTLPYSKEVATAYVSMLNNFPSNISLDLFYWSDSYHYGQYGSYYPRIFNSVSEPQLDNTYYPPYNVTKSFGTYCPAGKGQVYQSSSDDNTIKTVTCKDGNKFNVIVINTDTNSKNLSLNGLPTAITSLGDSNGNSYSVDGSGNVNLGIRDSYDILYLGQDTSTLIGAPCNPVTLTFEQLILDFAALAIIVFLIFYIFKDGIYEIDLTKILIMFIGLIVAIILFYTSADNLAIGNCGG